MPLLPLFAPPASLPGRTCCPSLSCSAFTPRYKSPATRHKVVAPPPPRHPAVTPGTRDATVRSGAWRMAADFYQTLGVSRNASEQEIKSAFRQKARKLHPDVNKAADAKERFQEVSRAYEVLSDPNMRQRYDQFGEAGVSTSAAGGPGGAGFADMSDFGFSDIFDTFFGGQTAGAGSGARGRRRNGPQQGDDLRLDVDVPFETAVFGGEQKIRFSHLETCNACDGSGIKKGSSMKTCTNCDGTGTVTQVVRTPLGMFQQTSTCTVCGGTGEVVEEYCGSCGGRGRNQVTKQLMITVPAGVDSGSRLRVRGEGDAGVRGGPTGDLYVVLRVKESREWRREGVNLYSEVEVSYLDAILGRKVAVKTVDGRLDVDVKAGTQPGDVIRIEGRGVPKLGNSKVRGDHFVTVKVKIPTRLSSAEKKLVAELDELSRGKGKAGSVAGNGATAGKERKEGFFNFGGKK
eukprot:GFKZ01000004.1.p1 GENE.GFKZ01000004.1~~GFKZ01000004.1.p1  ORF type:complete len:539 (+),score=78.17 GFKZ01000004.1:238-1617(+)